MTQNHSHQAGCAQCDVMAFLRLNTVTLIYCIELRCASRSNSLVQQIPFRLLISPKFSPTISQMVIFSRVIWRTLHPGWATFDSYPCFELQFHRQCGDSMFLSAFAWGHQMTSSLRCLQHNLYCKYTPQYCFVHLDRLDLAVLSNLLCWGDAMGICDVWQIHHLPCSPFQVSNTHHHSYTPVL